MTTAVSRPTERSGKTRAMVSSIAQSTIPVISGTAYSSARMRLHRVLRGLQIPEVSCTLAGGDFSSFYRSLPVGSHIQTRITSENGWLELRFEAEVPDSLCDQLAAERFHFQASDSISSIEGHRRLVLSRLYPEAKEHDHGVVQQLLLEPTAEEARQSASETEQALSTTQGRLSSVQEDLRIAADIQQRMLVSQERLECIHPGVDCQAHMIPCLDIGGDFYDIISLDTDHVAVVVGDVSGKGITAAMMMATCITLLRAYSESFRSPSRMMRKINPRLVDGNELDCLFTTLFLGMINLQKGTITYCNAGHNPAFIQRVDGSIEELAEVHGPAVGVFEQVPYEETRVRFDSGDRLLLYTDGVSENFNSEGGLYGVERILDFCRHVPINTDVRTFLADFLGDLKQFSGHELPHDDITLLAVQRKHDGQEQVIRRQQQTAATVEGIAELMSISDAFCQEQAISMEVSGKLQLVLDELLVNVVRYGQDEGQELPLMKLDLRYLPNKKLLVAELQDNGVPFNPFALAEPDTDLTIEERELGGLGIFLVRALARSFSYSYEEPWNTVLLEIDCQTEPTA